jgi:hypothetical protein
MVRKPISPHLEEYRAEARGGGFINQIYTQGEQNGRFFQKFKSLGQGRFKGRAEQEAIYSVLRDFMAQAVAGNRREYPVFHRRTAAAFFHIGAFAPVRGHKQRGFGG